LKNAVPRPVPNSTVELTTWMTLRIRYSFIGLFDQPVRKVVAMDESWPLISGQQVGKVKRTILFG
jgi:hypothetical protein